MNFFDVLLELLKNLYPTGLAFRFRKRWNGFHRGVALSQERLIQHAAGILDGLLPDNDNFTAKDADQWERRLGLINGTGVDLDDRKLAISRKMAYPGDTLGRSSLAFFQGQLTAAGFEGTIYRNKFDPGDRTYMPDEIESSVEGYFAEMGGAFSGGGEFGPNDEDFGFDLVINHLENERDLEELPEGLNTLENIGDGFRRFYYIGAAGFPTPAPDAYIDVPAEREKEFRQLILNLKPATMSTIVFVNYV